MTQAKDNTSVPTARQALLDLTDAATVCLIQEKMLPALCLCLIAVDTMASLSRPEGTDRVTRSHFVNWVDRYLLPGSGLPCSALEIYAARCGLLHTQSPRSELGEKGRVRDLWYAWGSGDIERLQRLADSSKRAGKVVVVKLEGLLGAINEAAGRFGDAVERDPELANLVSRRASRMFTGFTTYRANGAT